MKLIHMQSLLWMLIVALMDVDKQRIDDKGMGTLHIHTESYRYGMRLMQRTATTLIEHKRLKAAKDVIWRVMALIRFAQSGTNQN